MPSYNQPKRATEYIFYVSLVSRANMMIFQSSPTIAAGDFKVVKDGDYGSIANLTTLPTNPGGKLVKITLSATEMTADNVTVMCSDAAGDEWCDLTINIQTSTRQTDDLQPTIWSSSTAAVSLTNTTVATVSSLTAVATGGITAASFGAGAITASAIAADAITDAKVASDVTIASVTGAVGSVTGNVGGNVTGSVGSIATGGIAAASFSAGAIDAAAIANGAIDAATFAGDVAAEILSYIVDDATRIDASALNTASVTSIPAILADTNELQTDWVNGGRLDLLIDAIKAKTDNLPASPAAVGSAMTLESGERDSIAAALLDLTNGVETSLTMRQAMRVFHAVLAGKMTVSVVGTTATISFRDKADGKNRVTVTFDTAADQRTAVTFDLT